LGPAIPWDEAAAAHDPFVSAAPDTYARGRPYHHPRALAQLAQWIVELPVKRAVDVACGTGLSSVALSDLAQQVVGVEAVFKMVAQASPCEGRAYVTATAEALPVTDASVDLMTVAAAIHWFNQPAFFAEAARALRGGGWLAIYDHYFLGEIEGQPEFSVWNRDVYLQRFPIPPRGRYFDSRAEAPPGFVLVGAEDWPDMIQLTHGQLVDYILSQSNAVAAVADGSTTQAWLRTWLLTETDRFFSNEQSPQAFPHWATLACLQRT
jgi:ubiquinone/menaquinone biosynthesis C-methylase UbiE